MAERQPMKEPPGGHPLDKALEVFVDRDWKQKRREANNELQRIKRDHDRVRRRPGIQKAIAGATKNAGKPYRDAIDGLSDLVAIGELGAWGRVGSLSSPRVRIEGDIWHHFRVDSLGDSRFRGPNGEVVFDLRIHRLREPAGTGNPGVGAAVEPQAGPRGPKSYRGPIERALKRAVRERLIDLKEAKAKAFPVIRRLVHEELGGPPPRGLNDKTIMKWISAPFDEAKAAIIDDYKL